MPPVINHAEILKRAKTALNSGRTTAAIRSVLKTRAERVAPRIASMMVQELRSHPVTRELNSPVTTPSFFMAHYGNLASFYGITTSEIDSHLAEFSSLFQLYNITIPKQGNTFSVNITFPSIEQYYSVAQTQYGRSWLRLMENVGTFEKTLEHFLWSPIERRSKTGSRTGRAIQIHPTIVKRPYGSPVIMNIPYISDIYNTVLGARGKGVRVLSEAIRKAL
jgi:hypothetical protein